jgi:hypothetical protein
MIHKITGVNDFFTRNLKKENNDKKTQRRCEHKGKSKTVHQVNKKKYKLALTVYCMTK